MRGLAVLEANNVFTLHSAITPPRDRNAAQTEVGQPSSSQIGMMNRDIADLHDLGYCDPGYYCTDGGCCPDGVPLDQCGATITLSVIPPAGPEATSAAISEITSATTEYLISATTEYSTSTTEYTSLTTYTEVESSATTSSTEYTIYPISTEPATTTAEIAYPPVPSANATVISNITATYSPPAQYTGGAGRVLDTGIAYFSLGGLGALLMFL